MYSIIIERKSNGAKVTFEAPLLAPALKQHLREFCELAQALNETAFVKNWPQRKISLHFGGDGKVRDIGALPPDEEIAAFLHRLRPFFLNDERFNFNKTANQISAHFRAVPWFTDLIRELKRRYDGTASQKVYTIEAAGQTINSPSFFDDYVYALEYHLNAERRQKIDKIAATFPLEAQKSQFVLLLGMRLNAINGLCTLGHNLFAREDGSPIRIIVD